jgi:RNA polymerase sigma-70 factor, ECF subfamily
MPPWAAWWRGRETIAAFAKEAAEFCAEARAIRPIRANGQVAVAYYHLDKETGRYSAAAIDVLTLDGALISDITAFVTPAPS